MFGKPPFDIPPIVAVESYHGARPSNLGKLKVRFIGI